MLLHFHTNQLDFNMLDFSLICFHRKYCFPPRLCVCVCVCEHVYLSGAVCVCTCVCECVYACVPLLVVHGTFMSAQLFSFLANHEMCVCVWVCVCGGGLLQGQNELMLNIPYWFYCNSFLILSLFNFISLRLLGMEMRSVLLFFFFFSFFFFFFFACVNCSYHLKPFEQDYPDGLAWCAWSFIFLLCLLFLLGCGGKGEGAGKPPEGSRQGQEAAAVAKRDLGEEEEEEEDGGEEEE